ncbi:cytochrome P450 83B1-like [Senna tora]|uniref:Cytochrome P450 83B1-like n=1 Tax=Senna tora TaxID=362788 RepID=A0A834XG39_9FABA|nr:cytochrome P450 83B1-like [Senna tora]
MLSSFSPLFLLLLLLLLLCLTLFFFFSLRKQRTIKKSSSPPPTGPKGLPLIGNLHQLDNSALHKQLWHLSKTYGPIFSLKLGFRPTIVVSSSRLAKEVMNTYDLEFCDRPLMVGQQKLSYNGVDITFSPNNDYWREIRKICAIHIFSAKRVSSFSSLKLYEVKQMIEKISRQASSSQVTNLNETLINLTSTIICRVAFGKRYEEEGVERSRFHGLLNELQALMASFFVSDFIPFFGWIDKLSGLYSRLDKTFKELDSFFEEILNEHLHPNTQKSFDHHEEEDFIDVLLHLKNQNSFSFDFTYDHIKAITMDMLAAGTDTSAATTVWAMTALMKNPRIMHKVQAEVRNVGGNKGFIDQDGIQKLPYLKAVIKETFRLFLPAPLLVPRETNKKCTLDNGRHEIEAKTLVYVNAWAIQRDPQVWKDPEDFYPERFLFENEKLDFQGTNFELIPFGAGRRICPGMNFGVAVLELILANLLYCFDWEMPLGMKEEDIDFEMLPGFTMHKKNHLCLQAKNYIICE